MFRESFEEEKGAVEYSKRGADWYVSEHRPAKPARPMCDTSKKRIHNDNFGDGIVNRFSIEVFRDWRDAARQSVINFETKFIDNV